MSDTNDTIEPDASGRIETHQSHQRALERAAYLSRDDVLTYADLMQAA